MRHKRLPPSSDIISEPSAATATPTGRPQTWPSGRTKPVKADFFPAYDDDGGLLLVLTPSR